MNVLFDKTVNKFYINNLMKLIISLAIAGIVLTALLIPSSAMAYG